MLKTSTLKPRTWVQVRVRDFKGRHEAPHGCREISGRDCLVTSRVIDEPIHRAHDGVDEPVSTRLHLDLREPAMSAYAVAHLHKVGMGPEIVVYLQRIGATLEPFGGRFVIYGGNPEVLEGGWTGDLFVIEFRDRDWARGWYASPAYQAILRLRRDNSEGDVMLGCPVQCLKRGRPRR